MEDRSAAITADRDRATVDVNAYVALLDHRTALPDRLRREALRVVGSGAEPPVDLPTIERDAVAEEIALAGALRDRERQLIDDGDQLATLEESVSAKRAEIDRLSRRAQTLATARDVSAAQLEVLRELADDAAAAATAIAELTHGATAEGVSASWLWPVRGIVSQPFGPSAFPLEPPLAYHGFVFAHFHDAIDVAASFGSSVIAVAPGRVTFVGHLPDGAMVVVIAHDDGLVSLSAHLDDAFAPPPVKAGDRVVAGQRIGSIGMTGITTGPHLHFSVHDANGPVDPLAILAARS